MVEQGSGIAEKVMVVLTSLARFEEGRSQRVACEGRMVKGKEFAAVTLLQRVAGEGRGAIF